MNPYDKRAETVALRTTKPQYDFLRTTALAMDISKSKLINLMIEIADDRIRRDLKPSYTMTEYVERLEYLKDDLYHRTTRSFGDLLRSGDEDIYEQT